MSTEIINKVAESGLITLDLADLVREEKTAELDLAPFLFEGLILREKDFRAKLTETDWSIYTDKWVAVYCSTDAIVQKWAWMLIAKALLPFTSYIVFCTPEELPQHILAEKIATLDVQDYTDQRLVIKGCGERYVTEKAYLDITKRLLPVVKTLMYGEPCSTVPIYKKSAPKK